MAPPPCLGAQCRNGSHGSVLGDFFFLKVGTTNVAGLAVVIVITSNLLSYLATVRHVGSWVNPARLEPNYAPQGHGKWASAEIPLVVTLLSILVILAAVVLLLTLDLERADDEVAAAVPGPARLQRQGRDRGRAQRPHLGIAHDRRGADPVGVDLAGRIAVADDIARA